MRKNIRWAAAAAILIVAAGCSGKKELIAQQQAEITALQSRVGELEGNLSDEKARAERLDNQLRSALAEYQDKEQVLLDQVSEKSVVTVSDAALFRSGSTALTETGRSILNRIAEVVDMYPDREVLVEGHTDDMQIKPEFRHKFQSNWELSSARAHSALHYLRDTFDVPPRRLAAVGYGEHRPMTENATAEGRAANRRVVIVIGPTLEKDEVVTTDTPQMTPIP